MNSIYAPNPKYNRPSQSTIVPTHLTLSIIIMMNDNRSLAVEIPGDNEVEWCIQEYDVSGR